VGEVFPTVRAVAYFSTMRKRLALVASVLSLALLAPMSANGVEFGQDATGDPNAVWVMGASGFLYSDRIVFTAAHTVEFFGDNFARDAYLFAPGVKNGPNNKRYFAQKVLTAPTYRTRVGSDNTRVDDFAIIILRESMPVQNKVEVASAADIESFIREKAPVEMVGYGFQNESSRKDLQWRSSQSPHKMTSVLVSGEDLRKYYAAYPGWMQPNQTILDLGVPNNEKTGSNCDGDSGSGFFVQKGNVRYYIGAAGGSQAGITNCNGSFTRFAPHGGMSGVNPTYKFLSLIKEAEDFVANEKKLEAAS
jgi:secreted trypsin-like serine protease